MSRSCRLPTVSVRRFRPFAGLLMLAASMWMCSAAAAETVRCPVIADATLSINKPDGSRGAATTVNIQGRVALGIFAFDMSPAKGMTVEKAELRLKRRKGLLIGLTISTISAPWKPTDLSDWSGQNGRCGFLRRVWSEGIAKGDFSKAKFWAGPGSDFTDVIFGQGNSLYAEVRAELDEDGWYRIPVPPEMVETLAIGTQFGLCLYDTVGQRWTQNTVASAEAGQAERGYLLVTGRKTDSVPPAAPTNLAAKCDLPEPGEVLITWTAPGDDGTAGQARGYKVLYRPTGSAAEPKPLEAWHCIPQPAEAGKKQTMLVRDADLKPGSTYEFRIIALDEAGNRSAPAVIVARASTGQRVPRLSINITRPAVPAAAVPNVWAVPETASVSPVTGNLLSDGLEAYLNGPPKAEHRLANAIWNASDKTVRLVGARNWFFGFQIVAELNGKPRRLVVQAEDLSGPQTLSAEKCVKIYRVWYVKGAKGKAAKGDFADPLIPVSGPISAPCEDNGIAGQTNQAFFVDIYIPHKAKPGTYKTTIRVSDLNDPSYTSSVQVIMEVHPTVLPDELSFVPELNTYSSPAHKFENAPAGSKRYLKIEREYHRLAHIHRCNLNILGYSQSGKVKDNYAPPVEGVGENMRVVDWSKWDEQFGPYLDGSAFADLPRAGVPITDMYLPFHENWPCPVSMMKPEGLAMILKYLPKKYWPEGAEEFIKKHYKGDLTMEELFPPEYEAGCIAIARQFRDHFKRKGWFRTEFQVYLNNKYYWKEKRPGRSGSGSSWWLLDEPNHHFDIQALAYYGRLFMKGFEGAEPVKVIYRCDISRVNWVRDLLDDVLDMIAVSRRFYLRHRWLTEKQERFGWQVWSYGSSNLNAPDEPHLLARSWPLKAWLNGAKGLLQWQTIGGDRDFETANKTAMVLPGERFGIDGPIGTIRLKMWRSGQQDVELLAMLANKSGWNRTLVSKSVAQSCKQAGLDRWLYVDPVTTAYMVSNDAPFELHEAIRLAVLTELESSQ